MEVVYTEHARHALEAREISADWVAATLEGPEFTDKDPHDPKLQRFFRRIPEHEDRVLRVIVNTSVAPWRVVSVFFDRRMKGKL